VKASPVRVSGESVGDSDIFVALDVKKGIIRIKEMSNDNVLIGDPFMGCNGIGPDFNLSIAYRSSL